MKSVMHRARSSAWSRGSCCRLLRSRLNASPNGEPTRLLRSPAVSASHIAFAYANNIWVVERAGGNARRLTSFQGQTTNPHFSPDGQWIAFSGDYAGNTDVYVVPSEGGEPKRLTWHPGGDTVQGWTADGKSIMFASSRASWAPSGAPRFWTVPVEGRRRAAAGDSARLPGQDLTGRQPDRVPHEHLMGRGAPQLSGRPESPGLDRRSQDLRSRHAAVDRLARQGSCLGRRRRSISSRIATASRTSGPTSRRRRSWRR